jgi:hypothetical protein
MATEQQIEPRRPVHDLACGDGQPGFEHFFNELGEATAAVNAALVY